LVVAFFDGVGGVDQGLDLLVGEHVFDEHEAVDFEVQALGGGEGWEGDFVGIGHGRFSG